MEVENGLLFFWGEVASLDVWPQVVGPSEPAALAASIKSCKRGEHQTYKAVIHKRKREREVPTCKFWECSPAAMAMLLNVLDQLLVFFRSPGTFLKAMLITAGRSPH